MHIAAPALRPVSQHLYSQTEQEAVRWVWLWLLYCMYIGWGGVGCCDSEGWQAGSLPGAGQAGCSTSPCLAAPRMVRNAR
jgi:hypothetical protein